MEQLGAGVLWEAQVPWLSLDMPWLLALDMTMESALDVWVWPAVKE